MTDVFKDTTSYSLFFELVDSSTGLPKTGIVYTDVTGSYVRTRSVRVPISMATLTGPADGFSAGGFILIDNTNQPGIYRLDVPAGAFATGAFEVVISVKATGCRTVSRQINLVNINNQVAYVPNVAAADVGGLLTGPTTANTGLADVTRLLGTAWLTPGVAGTPDVNTKTITAGAVNAAAIGTDAIDADSLKADAVTEIQSGLALAATALSNVQWTNALATAIGVTNADLLNGGRLDLILDIIAADTTTDIPALISALENLSASEVNAEVLDVLNVDTFSELAAPPAATSSLRDKLTWVFMWLRNKSTETATQRKLYADNESTVVSTEGVTDDGTTFTKGEAV